MTTLSIRIPDEEKKAHFIDRTEKWAKLFNYGTLPFYWGGFEKEEGKPNTENLKKAALLLKDFNATVKGHPLCWHTGCAEWLLKYDNKTILEKQLARIYRDVGEFKGLIDMWDVINEVVIMPVYDKYDNAITRLCKEHGRIGLCKKVFDAAKDCNPNGTFLINDFNLSTSYEILIDGLLQSGVPINTIGLQSHQHHGVWGIEKLEEIANSFKGVDSSFAIQAGREIRIAVKPEEVDDAMVEKLIATVKTNNKSYNAAKIDVIINTNGVPNHTISITGTKLKTINRVLNPIVLTYKLTNYEKKQT